MVCWHRLRLSGEVSGSWGQRLAGLAELEPREFPQKNAEIALAGGQSGIENSLAGSV
jgi:hypothetical protein